MHLANIQENPFHDLLQSAIIVDTSHIQCVASGAMQLALDHLHRDRRSSLFRVSMGSKAGI